MRRTIVGIDPGTTVGYAVISTQGEVLKLGSMREHDTARVIQRIIEPGKPILIGCDKKNPPRTVDKISASLGARLVWPSEDLTTDDKKLLVRMKTKNSHEFDALASALFVHDSYKGLFEKIRRVLGDDRIDLLGEVQELMVKQDELNVNEAINIVQNKDTKKESRTKHKRQRTGIVKKDDSLLTKYAEDNALLRYRIKELDSKLRRMDRLLGRKGSGRDDLLSQKESRILVLEKKLKEKESHIASLRADVDELKAFISKAKKDSAVYRRIKDFSAAGFRPDLAAEDTLFVDNPDVRNNKVIEQLPNLNIIITPKKQVKLKDYTVVSADSLNILFHEDFVIVDANDLKKALDSKQVLKRIISEYKKSRP